MWGYLKRNRKLFTYNMLSTSTTITRHPTESNEKAQNLNNFHILLRLFHFFSTVLSEYRKFCPPDFRIIPTVKND